MTPGDRVRLDIEGETKTGTVQLVNRLVLVRPDEGPSVWRRPDEQRAERQDP